MDAQGFITPLRPQDAQAFHYAQPGFVHGRHTSTTNASMPRIMSNYSYGNASSSVDAVSSDGQPMHSRTQQAPHMPWVSTPVAPAYLANKRKSSPAVLGLPLGLSDKHQAKLRLHLSKQRNSIEAAMLLATFNRQTFDNRLTPVVEKDTDWPEEQMDTASVASLPEKPVETKPRRYSHDVAMTWDRMPPGFTEHSKFMQAHSGSAPSSSTGSSVFGRRRHHTTYPSVKAPWSPSHEPPATEVGQPHPYPTHPPYPTTMDPSGPPPHLQRPGIAYPPPPGYPPATHTNHHSMVHPLSAMKDPHQKQEMHHEYYPYPYPYGSSTMASHSVGTAAPQHRQQFYYNPHHANQAPLPGPMDPNANRMSHPMQPYGHPHGPPIQPAKRKKTRADEEEEMAMGVEPGHPEFPDMSLKDIEAARTDVEARPRRQKLRYPGDNYTPQWVRYNGQAKEGLCDTCRPGKWLQLKNSAFWYHKQFFHGISSVSGKEFMQPVETRWVDQDLLEGLCHQCHQWVAVSNVKRKNSVLWYRHAHKCHVYHKPKASTPKRR